MGEPRERARGGETTAPTAGEGGRPFGDRYSPLPDQGAGMTQRGFALLAVLWTLTAITAVAGATLAAVRLGGATTRNRVLLARAAWARESCIEILQARHA